MRNKITTKFISIVSLLVILMVSAFALVTILTTEDSQSKQTAAFIKILQEEQAKEEKLLSEAILKKGESIASLLVQNGAGLIVGYDFETLVQLAKNGSTDPDISFVTFFDKENKPLTKKISASKNVKILKNKIIFEKELIGFVEVGVDYTTVIKSISEISSRIKKTIEDTNTIKANNIKFVVTLISVVSLVVGILLCLAIFLLLSFVIIKPINKVVVFAKKMAEGDLTAKVDINKKDEIGTLAGVLNDMAKSLKEMIKENIITSQKVADGTSVQASSLEESSSSLEETSSMVKNNADNANLADNLMKETNKVVKGANTSMTQLIDSMEEISKSSEETSKIVKTIDEIAFKTNLLALNAAVEAARAGDAGAGFAVVADEVRNLAMSAAEAAKNTSELIEDTVKKVNYGVNLVQETSNAFGIVNESSDKVSGLIADIASASQEQAMGIKQINTNISEVENVTLRNAASADDLAVSMSKFIIENDSILDSGNNGKKMPEFEPIDVNQPQPQPQPQLNDDLVIN